MKQIHELVILTNNKLKKIANKFDNSIWSCHLAHTDGLTLGLFLIIIITMNPFCRMKQIHELVLQK